MSGFGCQSALPPSKATILHESYIIARAMGDDSTAYSVYAALATADTASWSWTQSSWKASRAILSATLGQLGYGTGPFTWNYGPRETAALSRFQHDLGLPATGHLDSLTVWQLLRAETVLKRADVALPDFALYKEGPYIIAKGTWKAITNKLGSPVNGVDIFCDATRHECSVVRTDFINEDLTQIAMHRNDFAITHWSDNMVVAQEGSSEDGATLTINIPAKEVLWSQVNSGKVAAAMGLDLGPSQMTMRLVNGMFLSSPSDSDDMKELHETLYREKDKYLALRRKNTVVDNSTR
jgi:hypothetical protein